MNGLQVDADYIPKLGFSSRDFGSKYHNLYSTTPVLYNLFSELPSMVAIDKFDCSILCFVNWSNIFNIFLVINEADPIKQRYETPVGDVLIEEPKRQGYYSMICIPYTL
jgi:hypothetical protein